MRPFRLPLLVALARLATLALAIPVAALVPRSPRFCSNAPHTIAGTFLSTRSLPPPHRRSPPLDANTFIYCAHRSDTYVVIKTGWAATNSDTIASLLNQAYQVALSRIATHGDNVVATSLVYGMIGSIVYMSTGGMTLRIANTNNHQTTWGVLGAAMAAMGNFVAEHGGFDKADFVIYDGDNQVAMGALGPAGR